jgi:hypothetical protein
MTPEAIKVGKTHLLFSGMCWPRIDISKDDSETLEWRLRYSTPSREDILLSASIIAAYRALVLSTQKNRNMIARILKFVENGDDT